jgi:hypothetical protein
MKKWILLIIELTTGFALLIGGAGLMGQGLPRGVMLAYAVTIQHR